MFSIMTKLKSAKKSVLKKIKFQEEELNNEAIEKKTKKNTKVQENSNVENQTALAINILTGKS